MSESLTTTAPPTALKGPKHRRPGSARALRALAVTLIVLGVLALADAVVTVVWQEPLTALYASIVQAHLGSELLAVEGTVPSPVERRTLATLPDEQARISYLAGELERHAQDGAAVGRILIPRVGADYVMVDGTDTGDLIRGPGIYRETHFPGIAGTTAVAGHRTTYLAPFREINLLKRGNHIL